jgi:hypothetical protein
MTTRSPVATGGSAPKSPLPFQPPPALMKVFAIRVELADDVAAQRLHDTDARTLTFQSHQKEQPPQGGSVSRIRRWPLKPQPRSQQFIVSHQRSLDHYVDETLMAQASESLLPEVRRSPTYTGRPFARMSRKSDRRKAIPSRDRSGIVRRHVVSIKTSTLK